MQAQDGARAWSEEEIPVMPTFALRGNTDISQQLQVLFKMPWCNNCTYFTITHVFFTLAHLLFALILSYIYASSSVQLGPELEPDRGTPGGHTAPCTLNRTWRSPGQVRHWSDQTKSQSRVSEIGDGLHFAPDHQTRRIATHGKSENATNSKSQKRKGGCHGQIRSSTHFGC